VPIRKLASLMHLTALHSHGLVSMSLTAFCTDASESIAVFVNQLIPTFTRCSSVGILRQYTSFLAAAQSSISFDQNIYVKHESERARLKVFVPACPRGPSKVSPSMKLAVIAASFLPSVIISPRFWNLQNTVYFRFPMVFKPS
jgi:hypothetical protein